MSAIGLPDAVAGALADVAASGDPRAARALSDRYRDGGQSATGHVVRSDAELGAYALARFPATYAAAVAAFRACAVADPDFAPADLLDVGAGLGATACAAVAVWPSISTVTCVENDPRAIAAGRAVVAAVVPGATWTRADVGHVGGQGFASGAELVTAGYLGNELADPTALARRLWSATTGVLVLVEPGRRAAYLHLLLARDALLAGGATTLAPCPHDDRCPLQQSDWCHFGQRLPRTAAHRQAKGADLPYEDEKFSYVAMTRRPVPERAARVIRRPTRRKGLVELPLCTAPPGTTTERVPRSNPATGPRRTSSGATAGARRLTPRGRAPALPARHAGRRGRTLYQLDAFADAPFTGNPAAVVLLSAAAGWPPDEILQAVAEENNLSETAFLHPILPGVAVTDGGPPPATGTYHLRWFTPVVEVDLCGHATLASAALLFDDVHRSADRLAFWTRSGWLVATRPAPGRVRLDFPAAVLQPATAPPEVLAALDVEPLEVWRGTDLFLLLTSAADVVAVRPDQRALAALDVRGVVVMAPGTDGFDVVSRFFGAGAGIGEDPVTGSAHSQFARYWAGRLGRTSFRARQLSARGGTVEVELVGDRALLTGGYQRFLAGYATLPD